MLMVNIPKCCIFPVCPGIADVRAGWVAESASGALLGPGPCRPPPSPGPGHWPSATHKQYIWDPTLGPEDQREKPACVRYWGSDLQCPGIVSMCPGCQAALAASQSGDRCSPPGVAGAGEQTGLSLTVLWFRFRLGQSSAQAPARAEWARLQIIPGCRLFSSHQFLRNSAAAATDWQQLERTPPHDRDHTSHAGK